MSKIKKNLNIVMVFKILLRIVLLPLVFIWLICKFFSKKNKTINQIDLLNIAQIDSLSGEEFEILIKSIFEKQGYFVSLTKKSHDFGADLILKMHGKISIVQAKRYENNIGIKAIQEIIAAKKHYMADDMFVVTNRYFSKEATILASEYGVKLIDRDVLIKLVNQFNPKIELSEKKLVALFPDKKQEIETKYKFWI